MPSTPRKIAELLEAHPGAAGAVSTGVRPATAIPRSCSLSRGGGRCCCAQSGYYPLHVVCENPTATMEIIELILRLHPAAASAVSAFGEYPLHNICRCALPPSPAARSSRGCIYSAAPASNLRTRSEEPISSH